MQRRITDFDDKDRFRERDRFRHRSQLWADDGRPGGNDEVWPLLLEFANTGQNLREEVTDTVCRHTGSIIVSGVFAAVLDHGHTCLLR